MNTNTWKERSTMFISIMSIVSIVLIVYSVSFINSAYDEDFYHSEFEKLGVYGTFEDVSEDKDADSDIDRINNILLHYLRHGRGQIEGEFFNEKEIAHLVDVRKIMQRTETFAYIALNMIVVLTALLTFVEQKLAIKLFFRNLTIAGIACDVIAALLGIFVLTFEKSFILLHKMLFANKLWILDPATDNLINMFPQQFFIDIAIKIMILALILSNIVLLVGIIGTKYLKKSKDIKVE